MQRLAPFFDAIDRRIAGWMQRWGRLVLRIALGVIFIWFGLLKPLGMSPAADMVKATVQWMPLVTPEQFLITLGWWEVAIGVCLLIRPLIRLAILLLFIQMGGTFLPLVILPHVTFTQPPFGLTIEGQYIVKNLLIIAAALVIGGTVRLPNGIVRT
jgi:uncharacterized membrane protein YphA (DoxX/SURF4 family)